MAECIHEWGNWEKMLWYTQKGRFVGEARRCGRCSAVETRNVEIDSRPAVVQPTIGVFGGCYEMSTPSNPGGGVLIKQIETGKFAGEWDLPGGGIDAEKASQAPDERIFWEELARHLKEEIGISVPITSKSQILTPAVLKGGGDWAFPIVVGTVPKPSKGITRFVDPREATELARGPEGNRILSGEGKRMHRLILRLLCHSPNQKYSEEAKKLLEKIGFE